jgi:MoaA/NifB/PqqE/SkfB family radical SAM enzyme/SAM-dependent methyltransferase
MLLSDKLHFERRDGYILVVDPGAPSWLATNEDGAWALKQWRAGRTRDGVSYRYARRAGVSLERAVHLIGRFAEEAAGFVSPGKRTAYRGRAHYLQPDRLREVWLHVTDRCNLACRHCLVSSGPERDDGVSAEALRQLIRQGCDLGADTFFFTGGEPLLRRDLPELLRQVIDCGATAVVMTNGTLLDEELAAQLGEMPREKVHLQVSLDGSSAERNDVLRSRGSFDGAVRGIERAVAAGLDVTVATVALRQNLDDLAPIAEVAHGLGVRQLHLMWHHTRERGARLRRAPLRNLQVAVAGLMARADELGLVVDNVENVRRIVNGDPNVKYDLSNACWDSLAIHGDGRVFPSACLVGIESEAGGSLLRSSLREIWLGSDRFDANREKSVVDLPGMERDPLLFLHGGGDPEQAFFAGNGDGQAPIDPYLPLHRMLTRAVIDATVAERIRLIGDTPAGPVVYHTMGEDGYGCPTEAGVRNGGEHAVDFVHSNCVLIQDVVAKTRARIQRYYAEAAHEPKTEICAPVSVDPRYLVHVPNEVIARSYGCGSPVFAAELQPGETIVDLGSGAGLECFVASRLVGKRGRVVGLDMTEEMLGFAESVRPRVAERLGYDNVRFERGLLESIPLTDEYADAVISNCVINLSPEKLRVLAEVRRVLKPGGRMVISDIVSERPLPAKIRFNPRLQGECIAGALTEGKLLLMLEKLGFADAEVLSRVPWRTVEGIGFDSVTVRAWKAGGGRRRGGQRAAPVALVSAVPQQRHLQDCMVCGAPLEYLQIEERIACHYCGAAAAANARCKAGHYVCDQCHTGDYLEFTKSFCARSTETDPVALFLAMRKSSLFPIHGPEHHALVPAAFLTAYRNRFGEPSEEQFAAALERARALPGGTCAFWGGCAAALGMGVAYSVILGATPIRGEARGVVQMVVSRMLAEIGQLGAPRCCRRESYLALKMGCELSGEYLPHALETRAPAVCDQVELNRECLGEGCPLFPG